MNLTAWVVVLAVVAAMAAGVVRAIGRRVVTDEQFERRAGRPSRLRAGLLDLQGFLEPGKKASTQAVEEQQRKREQQEQGDPPQAGLPGGGN